MPAFEPDFARDFLAFEAIVVLRGGDSEREVTAGTAKTGLSGSTSLRPCAFPRIRFSEDGGECRICVDPARDNIDPRSQRYQGRKVSVTRISVAETPRSAPCQISEPDIGKTDPRERIEEIQLLEAREIAFDDAVGKGAVLAPLDVDRDLTAAPPIRMEQCAMPKGPNIGRRAGRVVTDPKDLFIGRDGKRNPGPVDVVAPEQVIGDEGQFWVDDRNDAFEWEPLVALDV